MKTKTRKILHGIVLILLGTIFAFLLSIIFSSCSLIRELEKNSSDSTNVNKGSATQVSKNENTDKSSDEWWREKLTMFMQRKDSNIINVNVPSNPVYIPTGGQSQPQPIFIYEREGGNKTTEQNKTSYDSLFRAFVDSTSRATESKEKKSETEVLGASSILALFAGLALILAVVVVAAVYLINKRFSQVLKLIEK